MHRTHRGRHAAAGKAFLGALAGAAALGLLAACGGANQDDESWKTDARLIEAQKLGDRLPVSWSLDSLAFAMIPGTRQGIPVKLTSTVALMNARIVFIPDLRNAVTVHPETVASLAAGESTTVTLTFSPSGTDKRKAIVGVALLFDRNATISKPLWVKVDLVKPEKINGTVVPPEPPQELNNATLPGFDANGNGVRDDVERLIATKFGGSPDFPYAFAYAAQYQQMVVGPAPTQRSEALERVARQICAAEGASIALYKSGLGDAVANTDMRRQTVRVFNEVLAGYSRREIPPCVR